MLRPNTQIGSNEVHSRLIQNNVYDVVDNVIFRVAQQKREDILNEEKDVDI